MDSLPFRCQHEQVNWVGPNRCKCASCGKVGHWFEEAELVMWFRGRSEVKPMDCPVQLEGPATPVGLQAS